MNKLGRALEDELYACLQALVADHHFGFRPDTVAIHRQKKYNSGDRSTHVETDVSLEFTLPGADWPAAVVKPR